MTAHPFLFDSGMWTGVGEISFSMAEDRLSFHSQWVVHPKSDEIIIFTQQITMKEAADAMENRFSISDIKSESFFISLENELVGKVYGQGVLQPELIAWEFRGIEQGFEGFEIYDKISDTIYAMRAEFTAGEGLRTFIKGEITKKKAVP